MATEAVENKLQIVKPEETVPTALTRVTSFAPRTFDEAVRFAKMIANASFCPPALRGKAGDVFYVLQTGAELSVPPLQALSGIALINGRTSLYGDLFLAVIQKHPDYEWHREWWEGDGDTRAAYCEFKRRNQDVHKTRFTVEDAKRARLWGKEGPWTNYPDRMLQMRARGFCGRDRFADALKGMVIYEEALDTPPAKVVEHAKFDTAKEVAALTESSEPNRGHGQEGFAEPTPEAIPAPTDATAPPVAPTTSPETETSPAGSEPPANGFTRGVVTVTSAEQRKFGKKDCVVLMVSTSASPIYVWDKKLHEYALKMVTREVDLEVSASRKENDPKVYWSLENIYRVDDCYFVNNKPVAQKNTGKLESPTGLFPPAPHQDKG